MNPRRTVVLLSVVWCTFAASHAIAAPVLTAGTETATNFGYIRDSTGAYDFVANRALELTALGVWDHAANGLPQVFEVSLWDTATQTLLAAASIDSADPSIRRLSSQEDNGDTKRLRPPSRSLRARRTPW